jgi:hypothetical protein
MNRGDLDERTFADDWIAVPIIVERQDGHFPLFSQNPTLAPP